MPATISGQILQAIGLGAPGPVSNELVGLYGASGQLIATTRSQGDGSYTFLVGLPTVTVSQTLSLPVTYTNFSQAFSPQLTLLNPVLGHLDSVTIATETDVVSQLFVNNHGGEVSQVDARIDATVGLTNLVPGGVAKLAGSSPTSPAVNVDPGSSQTITLRAVIPQTYVFDQPGDLAFYTGNTTRTATSATAAAVQVFVSPNGNTDYGVVSTASASVVVTYQYTPVAAYVVRVLDAVPGTTVAAVSRNGQAENTGSSVVVAVVNGSRASVDFTLTPRVVSAGATVSKLPVAVATSTVRSVPKGTVKSAGYANPVRNRPIRTSHIVPQAAPASSRTTPVRWGATARTRRWPH